jgi:hypothetical protein
MINQQQLYQLFLQNTGKSIYQVKAVKEEDQPRQAWQPARVMEYYTGIEVR